MHKLKAALVGLLCLVAITGCTTNTNPGDVKFTTVATMQLAMGTINDSAGVLERRAGAAITPGTYLDVIATFRNQFGNSAYIVPGAATLTQLLTGAGNAGSIFGYGQGAGTNGLIAQGPAWASPLSDTGYLKDVLAGGLPALPVAVAPINFTLSTTVSVNGTPTLYSAPATLMTKVPMAAAGNAVSWVPGAVGSGGGTLTISAPVATATEQVAVIIGPGTPACPGLPCPLPFIPAAIFPTDRGTVVAEFEVTGATTVIAVPAGTLAVTPAGSGEGPIPYSVFVVDADFPWVEAGLVSSPAVGTPTPVITNGVNGQADLSASGKADIILSP
jgi:hypothetical protein